MAAFPPSALPLLRDKARGTKLYLASAVIEGKTFRDVCLQAIEPGDETRFSREGAAR